MKKSFLIIGDIITLYIALVVTLVARYGLADISRQLGLHVLPFSLIFAFWILFFYIANLYELSLAQNNIEFFSTLYSTTAINILLAVAFFYFLPLFVITPKTNLFIFVTAYLLFFSLWRYYFNEILKQSGLRNNTLIIGINQQASTLDDQSKELFNFLGAHRQLGYNALDVINMNIGSPVNTLEEYVTKHHVKVLVLSPAVYKIPQIIDMLYRLLRSQILIFNLPSFFERVTGKVPLGAIDQTWFLENLSGRQKRLYEFGKRIMDTIGAVVVGIATLPFYPFIMLAIKIGSSGPIFYRQQRVGCSGKVFWVIKFRTMVQSAEENGPTWAIENDIRTTHFGKLLRRTRIDEIPQLWNVLRGELSFIGPRPERPEFHEKLKAEIPFYEERYLVKPGLTGWAQIKFKLDFKGAMTIQDTAEKVKYDLYYIKNRSLLLDLGILLKTINIIVKKIIK